MAHCIATAGRFGRRWVWPPGKHAPLAMARRLADEHRCSVVVTYSGYGMVAAERDGGVWYLPAEWTEVRDVCGAGDTVLAALGAALLAGNSLRRACHAAVITAGQQIACVGIKSAAIDLADVSKSLPPQNSRTPA